MQAEDGTMTTVWSIVSQHPAGMYDPASGAAFITRLGLPARPGPDR